MVVSDVQICETSNDCHIARGSRPQNPTKLILGPILHTSQCKFSWKTGKIYRSSVFSIVMWEGIFGGGRGEQHHIFFLLHDQLIQTGYQEI